MYAAMKLGSSYVFSGKNTIKILGATLIDCITTAINIIAPVIIVESVKTEANSDAHQDSASSINTPLILASVGLLVAQALPKLRNMLVDSVRANVQKEITMSLVKKTFENEFDQQVGGQTGEFSQALFKNYTSIEVGVPCFFSELTPATLEIMATSIFLTVDFGPIGLTLMGILAIYGIVSFHGERSATPIREACSKENYLAYPVVVDAVGNYQIAHQFGNVAFEMKKVDVAQSKLETKYREKHFKNDVNALKLSIINGLGFVGAMLAFFAVPPGGKLNAADFALYAYFMTRMNVRLEALPGAITGFNTSLVEADQIVNYLHKRSAVVDVITPTILDTTSPLTIEFRDVSFSYQDKLILDRINFKVEPGQKLAITGPTGCGKSTIMRLLQRFYLPTTGTILVNGTDIALYSAESLRKHFAVVSQDSAMFNDSIQENIRYGDLDATDQDVLEAATLSELLMASDSAPQAILAKSAGLQGAKLSGGEKQRIAIARAILKGGAACILDEPTSALDLTTERDVQRMLDRITNHATTLLITHRLATVVNAAEILYIEDGKIVERGTFQALLEQGGKFFSQLEVQCTELGIDISTIRPTPIITDGVFHFWQRRIHHRPAAASSREEHSVTVRESFDGMSKPLLDPTSDMGYGTQKT